MVDGIGIKCLFVLKIPVNPYIFIKDYKTIGVSEYLWFVFVPYLALSC